MMGTWGTGNFDSDGAADYVNGLAQALAKQIDDILDSATGAEAHEWGEARLVPAVVVLTMLCEQCKAGPPNAEKVADWRSRYLAAFDRSMPALVVDKNFLAERRAVVVRTFASLQALASRSSPSADTILVCCPHCFLALGTLAAPNAPFAPPASCPHCGADPRSDACFEVTRSQWEAQITKTCARCGQRMHMFASRCGACRTDQH